MQLDDPRVSRLHAVIETSPEVITLIDLGSSDGTQVNGVRVAKQRLASGDRLLVGATTIAVTILD